MPPLVPRPSAAAQRTQPPIATSAGPSSRTAATDVDNHIQYRSVHYINVAGVRSAGCAASDLKIDTGAPAPVTCHQPQARIQHKHAYLTGLFEPLDNVLHRSCAAVVNRCHNELADLLKAHELVIVPEQDEPAYIFSDHLCDDDHIVVTGAHMNDIDNHCQPTQSLSEQSVQVVSR